MKTLRRDDQKEKVLGGCTGKGFLPGQSGNPKGRPRTTLVSDALRRELARHDRKAAVTVAEGVAKVLIKLALEGDVMAIREVLDRTEGKPKQAIDVDMRLTDWRELARDSGLSEADVIREARLLLESYNAEGDAEGA